MVQTKKGFRKYTRHRYFDNGINAPWPMGCINSDFHNSYYKEFIPWIVKISNEFPSKKVFYKHHNYFKGDTRETELLNNSNLKVIVNDKSLNSTYGWAFRSKIIISFASTMIVELLGNGKQVYFIDPGGINYQWFYGINDLEMYKIKTYDPLKKLLLVLAISKMIIIYKMKNFSA